MDTVTPISDPQRLLPGPARSGVHARTHAPETPARSAAPAPARPAVWTLPREVAQAACAAQMLAPARRGLKADPAERARYARAYGRRPGVPAGLMLKETA